METYQQSHFHWNCNRLTIFKLYRASSRENPSSPYIIYPSSLFCLDLGYALWYPEPHDSGEVQIGDVGYVHQGAFIRAFNINTSEDKHKVTWWKKRFEITEPPPEDVFVLDKRGRPIEDGPYLSRGVQEKEIGGSVSA